MRVAEIIASCLIDAEFPNVFPKSSPSALDFPEAIVLCEGAFERASRIEGEERGTVPVTVLVVREVSADGEAVVIACEQCVRHWQWELAGEAWPWRVVGVDTAAPALRERDSSGRFVWAFEVSVTVARQI